MKKDESIRASGKIRSISDPFGTDCTNQHLITVETKKGLFSLPVGHAERYVINQDVELFVTVQIKEILESDV